jgi:hypothetical protein
MISPIKIALQGLQPGSTPIEIGTQGFIVTITPPTPEEDGEDIGLFPIRYHGPADTRPYDSRRKDCVIHVTGCSARLTATGANVADPMPTWEELDLMDDAAFFFELHEREVAAAEEHAHRQFLLRQEQARKKRAERKRQWEFRKETQRLADEITTHGDTNHDLAALIVFLKDEVSELSNRILELERDQPAATPKPKTRRKK